MWIYARENNVPHRTSPSKIRDRLKVIDLDVGCVGNCAESLGKTICSSITHAREVCSFLISGSVTLAIARQ